MVSHHYRNVYCILPVHIVMMSHPCVVIHRYRHAHYILPVHIVMMSHPCMMTVFLCVCGTQQLHSREWITP